MGRKTDHLEELVAFVQVGHDDALSLRDRPVYANELPLLPHRVDLMQRKLVLRAYVSPAERTRP